MSIREKLEPAYDLTNDLHGLSYVQNALVKTYETVQDEPLVVEGKLHVFVDPFEGGVTQTFKAKTKRLVSPYEGLYVTDFVSPRQQHGGPKSNESKIDFYSRKPYVVKFRFDEDDISSKTGSTMQREEKISRQVVRKIVGYKPDGDVEKMIGEMATQELGLDDAPEKFFKKVKKRMGGDPEKALEDDSKYDDLMRAVVDVANEDGYLKD